MESYLMNLLLVFVLSAMIVMVWILVAFQDIDIAANRLSGKQIKIISYWLISVCVPLFVLAIIPLVFVGLSWIFYRIIDFILTNKMLIVAMFVLPAVIFFIGWRAWLKSKNS